MATLTVYPTTDGSFSRTGVESWPNKRAGTDANTWETSAQLYGASIRANITTNLYDRMNRSGFIFNTSALPDGATITGAVFSIVIYSKTEDITGQSVSLVAFNPADPGSIVVGDYDQFGTTKFATDIALADITADGTTYTNFTLNASGLAAISKTGNTLLGIRLASDNDNSEPTWLTEKEATVSFQSSATTGTDKDPKLVITYSATSVKKLNTIAQASLKKINTIAIANVKKINTIA